MEDSPISVAVDSASNVIKQLFDKDLAIPLRSQLETIKVDKMGIYACLFTCHLMIFSARKQQPIGFQEYKNACIKAKAMRDDFWILDANKMQIAAGFQDLKCTQVDVKSAVSASSAIYALVFRGIPVIISLSGKHYECIVGYEHKEGKLFFEVNDPHYSGKTWCQGSKLQMFREIDGVMTPAKDGAGNLRFVTSYRWFE